MGWGFEQAPWSTTSSRGDVKPIIDPGLRNQWLLYYIIIDGARKCHRQSTTYYLLCWIVSRPCQATVFCSRVPTPCLFIPRAFSFHISLVIPSWEKKMNTDFCSGAGKEIHFSRYFKEPMLSAKVWAEGRWASKKDDLMSEGKWVALVHIAFSQAFTKWEGCRWFVCPSGGEYWNNVATVCKVM